MNLVPTDDRGLLLGDGLFETVLSLDGRLAGYGAHYSRMLRGCAVLGLPVPDDEAMADAGVAALAEAGLDKGRAAVRFTWTAGSGGRGLDRPDPIRPRLIVAAFPAPPPRGTATLATVSVRRNEASPLSRIKSLAYLDNVLARREARAAGADEALMLNGKGQVACASAANLFWFEGDRLFTPALDCGVLDGVMRGLVLAEAAALGLEPREVDAEPGVLARVTGLFLTNSLIGVRAVSALDGKPVLPNPATERLGFSWSW